MTIDKNNKLVADVKDLGWIIEAHTQTVSFSVKGVEGRQVFKVNELTQECIDLLTEPRYSGRWGFANGKLYCKDLM